MSSFPFKLILLVLAFVCFLIGATNFVQGENRSRLISAGWACAALALMV